jgi:hypothetical protein
MLGAGTALLLAAGLFARWTSTPAVYEVVPTWPEASVEGSPARASEVRELRDPPAVESVGAPGARSFESAVTDLERAPSAEPAADDDLQFAEQALQASRQLGESLAGHADGPPPTNRSARTGGAARGAPSVPVACTNSGGACLSNGECCGGLACAGAVAGYGVEGRCERSR